MTREEGNKINMSVLPSKIEGNAEYVTARTLGVMVSVLMDISVSLARITDILERGDEND